MLRTLVCAGKLELCRAEILLFHIAVNPLTTIPARKNSSPPKSSVLEDDIVYLWGESTISLILAFRVTSHPVQNPHSSLGYPH